MKTIREYVLDMALNYPGMSFDHNDIASFVITQSNGECKISSVKRALLAMAENSEIKKIGTGMYEFKGTKTTELKATKAKKSPKMKGRTFVGIVRDHSGSMGGITNAAMKDYNNTIQNLKDNAKFSKTFLSVVGCGVRTHNSIEVVEANKEIDNVMPLSYYEAYGNTPLIDSILQLIRTMQQTSNAKPEDAFMVIIITDGGENGSYNPGRTLQKEISELQGSGKWTFAFRVPRGYKNFPLSIGIPNENIMEWETTSDGMNYASNVTMSSLDGYYSARSRGITQTNKFFVDTSNVSKTDLKKLDNIKNQINFLTVLPGEPNTIRDFFEHRIRKFEKGSGFYKLVKTEKIQDYKKLIVRHRVTGDAYTGHQARNLLGLPLYGEVKIAPGKHTEHDIFIQSTSVNRVLPVGTSAIYWEFA